MKPFNQTITNFKRSVIMGKYKEPDFIRMAVITDEERKISTNVYHVELLLIEKGFKGRVILFQKPVLEGIILMDHDLDTKACYYTQFLERN